GRLAWPYGKPALQAPSRALAAGELARDADRRDTGRAADAVGGFRISCLADAAAEGSDGPISQEHRHACASSSSREQAGRNVSERWNKLRSVPGPETSNATNAPGSRMGSPRNGET